MPCTYTGMNSTLGTIQNFAAVRDGWAFFQVSTRETTILLCVPEGWTVVESGVSMRSWMWGHRQPPWFQEISPEIFTALFHALQTGGLSQRHSLLRSSAETVRPTRAT